MKTVFLSGDGIKDDIFISTAGEYAEGVYATAPWDTSRLPHAVAAVRAHQKEYGEPPAAFFLTAYAATLAWANAVEKAGSTEYEAVSRALRTEHVETPVGNITFDERGDAVGVGFSVYQVRNGVFDRAAPVVTEYRHSLRSKCDPFKALDELRVGLDGGEQR